MQRLLLFTAFACLLFISCSKDSIITPPDNNTTTTVNGFFSVSYDTTRFRIDSMRTYFLNATGILDSTVLKDSAFRSKSAYTWNSPARRYRSTDSAFAKVFAWGKFKGTGTVLNVPPVTFSESVITLTDSTGQSLSTKDGKNGFVSAYGFRLK